MNGKERREFVRQHKTCIFGYGRQKDGPSMSVVYYAMDGDDIVLSTMRARAKAKAIMRNPKISLCVLDENWPLTYLLVYGDAQIEEDPNADMIMKVSEIMSGGPIPESKRAQLIEMSKKEDRVVVRMKPYATFESPPRHVYKPSDIDTLTHDLGQNLAWDAD